mmetsp:Transcript_37763/g.106713  ORF Transcript_37763/g.106713 Transcript_37763/m.106713 type:complete len:251 (+) Transcript_37763:121-873(+)
MVLRGSPQLPFALALRQLLHLLLALQVVGLQLGCGLLQLLLGGGADGGHRLLCGMQLVPHGSHRRALALALLLHLRHERLEALLVLHRLLLHLPLHSGTLPLQRPPLLLPALHQSLALKAGRLRRALRLQLRCLEGLPKAMVLHLGSLELLLQRCGLLPHSPQLLLQATLKHLKLLMPLLGLPLHGHQRLPVPRRLLPGGQQLVAQAGLAVRPHLQQLLVPCGHGSLHGAHGRPHLVADLHAVLLLSAAP